MKTMPLGQLTTETCDVIDPVFGVPCQQRSSGLGEFHRHLNSDGEGTTVYWSDEDDPDPYKGSLITYPSPFWPGGFTPQAM